MGLAARLTGFRWFERNKRDWRAVFRWAEISGQIGLALGLHWYGDDEDEASLHIHLIWPKIKVPLRIPHERVMGGFGPSYGISVHRYEVHLNWGEGCKILHWPWSWQWVRSSKMMKDGSWLHELASKPRQDFPNYPIAHSEYRQYLPIDDLKKLMWQESYPYRYVLRSGEIQERTATLRVEEREWRWRAFQWLPFPRHIQRTIDIEFNDEVGERTGSWKGGTIGCSYELRPQEMPVEALRRMEAERVFR